MSGSYERELAKPGHVPGEYQSDKATTIPGPGTDDRPIVWRLWWQFVFTPLNRVVTLLPIAEWRQEAWVTRVDIWAMRHIGPIRFRP